MNSPYKEQWRHAIMDEIETLIMLHVTHASTVTRPFKLVRDLQHTNRSSPAEGAGKGSFLLSFFLLSHADGPLCVIHVNCNSSSTI